MNPIAKAIFDQLGGNSFVVMTGAKNFVQDTNSLQFRIGRGAKNKINTVRVTLDPSDTYTVEFFYIRAANCNQIGESVSDVYCDQLQGVFTEATGFYTHF